MFNRIKRLFVQSENSEAPVPSQRAIVNTHHSNLNIRPFPTLLNQPITSIPKGSRIKVTGKEGDWLFVTYHGVKGYAYDRYVLILDTPLQ